MTNQLPNDVLKLLIEAMRERTAARKEAEDLRDMMRLHIHKDLGPYTFSWEKEEKL